MLAGESPLLIQRHTIYDVRIHKKNKLVETVGLRNNLNY
jgi:hypothetical protein